jgi:hypothetical protein
VSDRKVLVVGPSLAAEFMNLMGTRFNVPGIRFTIYSINGRAFTTDKLVDIAGNQLVFLPVTAQGDDHQWLSNNQDLLRVDLTEYHGVLHLDPLFMLGGFMRWQLWNGGCGICYEFLPNALRHDAEQLPKNPRPISSSEWLAIYREARQGTLKTLEAIRHLRPDIPILLIPPANPPQRLNTGIYPQYNMREQMHLGSYLQARFGTSFALQPRSTVDDEFRTFDHLHRPAPDMHHPTHEYYRVVLESIDFQEMKFAGEMRNIWITG